LGGKLADYRSMSVKLDLAGSLEAGKVSTMADVARARIVAGVLVSGKNRDRGHHQQGTDCEERYILPKDRHW